MSAKQATTIDKQIETLKSRGMIIEDYDAAFSFLQHTSYYRLGSYSFPFEVSYPCKINRNHRYNEGTQFSDVIELYNYDFELRALLLKYLSIIEVSFKTVVVNIISNLYPDNPNWFVDPSIVQSQYALNFKEDVYLKNGLRKNRVIANHEIKYPKDTFPPAWKTIEYMTFGSVFQLFESLNDLHSKHLISKTYNLEISVFLNYIKVIRDLRNICAHGSVIFDYCLPYRLKKSSAIQYFTEEKNTNIGRLSELIQFFLKQINPSNELEYKNDLNTLLLKFKKNRKIDAIIKKCCSL